MSLVPTGTVDFTMTSASRCSRRPSSCAQFTTCDRSAEPSSPEGVPTAMKMMSA